MIIFILKSFRKSLCASIQSWSVKRSGIRSLQLHFADITFGFACFNYFNLKKNQNIFIKK